MDDAEDLVERLCTEIGMIMEDEVDGAILRGRGRSTDERIARLEQADRDIMILASAASLLARRSRDASNTEAS